MEMFSLHIVSFAIAMVAFVYAEILTQPRMFLNGFYKLIDKLPYWICYPIIGCFKCVAGQIACWYFIYRYDYDFFTHIYFISITIFISIIINFIYGRIKNN